MTRPRDTRQVFVATLVVVLQLVQGADGAEGQVARCVPVGAPDYGTCAGLDGDCCNLWLLECDLTCSNLVLGDAAEIPADKVQEFSCSGQTVKYACQCEGDACPPSYCSSSQCLQSTQSEYFCDLPCSPKEYDVQCPAGKIPKYVKSFPLCPEHTTRYSCNHFDRCQDAGGQATSLRESRPYSASRFGITQGDEMGITKNSAAKAAGSAMLLLVLALVALVAPSHGPSVV